MPEDSANDNIYCLQNGKFMSTPIAHVQYAFKKLVTSIWYIVLISVFVTLPITANAHQYKIGDIEIVHPWTRTTLKGTKVSSGYFHIINHGNTPDRLISVETDGVKTTEIHSMAINNDIMQMKHLTNGIEIPGSGEIKLKPGGDHIMFMGLSQPFQKGDKINAKLTFEKAGVIDIYFNVDASHNYPTPITH
ncbi:copper chaperone PCu(A)C [Bartonella bacilliformis]|nr:copper chaperone PCu(A)C [Bartonella bacilliformis]EKS43208.1 putative membrane protein [Bartonella bacilliformis INS]